MFPRAQQACTTTSGKAGVWGLRTATIARAQPFFPFTRFGRYFVMVKDAAGKITSFETFEPKRFAGVTVKRAETYQQARDEQGVAGQRDSKPASFGGKLAEAVSAISSETPAAAPLPSPPMSDIAMPAVVVVDHRRDRTTAQTARDARVARVQLPWRVECGGCGCHGAVWGYLSRRSHFEFGLRFGDNLDRTAGAWTSCQSDRMRH
jgi:hypothetical protein